MTCKDKYARRYLRHSARVPIVCRPVGHSLDRDGEMRDISFGGMAFATDSKLAPGDVVHLDYPTLASGGLDGEVIWIGPSDDEGHSYRCGVRFMEPSMFCRARLIEQILRIEAYRRAQQSKYDRHLTPNEAAREWIAKEADRFPR